MDLRGRAAIDLAMALRLTRSKAIGMAVFGPRQFVSHAWSELSGVTRSSLDGKTGIAYMLS
jgi:hypothetical protein